MEIKLSGLGIDLLYGIHIKDDRKKLIQKVSSCGCVAARPVELPTRTVVEICGTFKRPGSLAWRLAGGVQFFLLNLKTTWGL